MPNRILRDWRDSERINALSPGAERFFTRLIMSVDDYGLFHAQGELIRAALFPMQLDRVSIRDVYGWMEECAVQELIQFYIHKGRDYLRITDFRQRLRIMRSRYPIPDDAILTAMLPAIMPATLPADGLPACPPETEAETETNLKEKPKLKLKQELREIELKTIDAPIGASVSIWPTFDDFWETYGKKIDRSKCEAAWKKINQGGREKIMAHLRDYISATPDIQYRRNPLTYLRNQSWNDAIIFKHGKQDNLTATLLASIAERSSRDHGG